MDNKILIFDMGGVLFDWRPKDFMQSLLPDCPSELAAYCFFQDYTTNADWLAFDKGAYTSLELARKIAYRFSQLSGELKHLHKYTDPLTVHNLIEALCNLVQTDQSRINWINGITTRYRGKVKLFYLSNMPKPFSERLVKTRQIFECFQDGIFSHEVNLIKPDRGIFKLAEARFHIQDSSRVMFIDDRIENIQAAITFGWKGILFRSIAQAEELISTFIAEDRPVRSRQVRHSVSETLESISRDQDYQKRVRSFVVRAGRMGSGQKRALQSLGHFYLIQPQVGCVTASVASSPGSSLDAGWSDEHRGKPLIIEIGFGMGDALAAIAAADRSKRYLGIDVHPPGVGSMLQQIENQRLTHVRLIQHDAVDVLEKMIADNSVTGFHIYFPDPWPKKRHHKRRLIQTEFVKRMSSCLKVGGYIHCATDWEPYAKWMLDILSAESSLMNQADGYHARPAWRPMTKFEARGLRLGHVVNDLLFRKR